MKTLVAGPWHKSTDHPYGVCYMRAWMPENDSAEHPGYINLWDGKPQRWSYSKLMYLKPRKGSVDAAMLATDKELQKQGIYLL